MRNKSQLQPLNGHIHEAHQRPLPFDINTIEMRRAHPCDIANAQCVQTLVEFLELKSRVTKVVAGYETIPIVFFAFVTIILVDSCQIELNYMKT